METISRLRKQEKTKISPRVHERGVDVHDVSPPLLRDVLVLNVGHPVLLAHPSGLPPGARRAPHQHAPEEGEPGAVARVGVVPGRAAAAVPPAAPPAAAAAHQEAHTAADVVLKVVSLAAAGLELLPSRPQGGAQQGLLQYFE